MTHIKNYLRENNFFAKLFTFGMIPLCWRMSIGLARRFGYEDKLLLIGVIGIWVGVAIGHQLYYRWLFPEKTKPTKCEDPLS